ncbi:hypothetical protein [Mesonia sp. K7]|uniref:hypothetical protein n=1 Tax=Mesonia sp. K7 TaxID=2218606 RepID=UPI000DA81D2C|nr:hypothetical protein [Mesonia sp. K7]PZD76774.1 hypothetical protein DNG35_10960 [Mesonia sp. K7]
MKNFALSLMTMLMLSCNFSDKKQEESLPRKDTLKVNTSVEHPQEITEENKIVLEVIEDWRNYMEGCSCYFGTTKENFKSQKWVYLDNYDDTAYIKIDGKVEKLPVVEDNKKFTYKKFENEAYEITLKTEQTNQIDEVWDFEGILIVKTKDGSITKQAINGACGC